MRYLFAARDIHAASSIDRDAPLASCQPADAICASGGVRANLPRIAAHINLHAKAAEQTAIFFCHFTLNASTAIALIGRDCTQVGGAAKHRSAAGRNNAAARLGWG